ncbi:MFS transporter [Rugosimonospora acidiphila]|uniref:MFS transporter n=1 Tax=Rugosimonospora acidiphila TaxID=556531 RepID=A0ABP9RQM2_9ACTN
MLTPHAAVLRRARVAASLLFLLYGTILGTWTARIPAVKHRLALTDGQLSLALLAFAAGAIIGMQASGRLVDRYGSGAVMVPAVLIDGVALVGPALAPNLPGLAGCLLGFGAVHGILNVAMNVNAVEVQRARERPMISSCHAVYSIGGFAGAGIGGLFARAALGPTATFLTVTGLAVVASIWVARWALPAGWARPEGPDAGVPEPEDRTPGAMRGMLFMGLLVFCCLVGEGAAADWGSVYLRDSLGTGAGLAASAYAAFSIAMMAGRLVGDRLAAAVGPVSLVRVCGVLASLGLAAGLLVGRPIAGVAGFGLLGAGLSCIAPQVFSAAGSRNPTRAGQAIARVAGLGFLGFVVGPVVIGGTAQLVGLPRALGIPAVLALAVAASAPALRPRPALPVRGGAATTTG